MNLAHEFDPEWHRVQQTEAEEEAWSWLLERHDRADEHSSRWAGAIEGTRNAASPGTGHDVPGSPASRPAPEAH